MTSYKKGKPKKKKKGQKIRLYKETRPELKLKVFAVAKAFGGNMGHVLYKVLRFLTVSSP